MAVRDWLANTDISGAEFEVNKAAEVTHLSCDLVANIGVIRVRVVRERYLGGSLNEPEPSFLIISLTPKLNSFVPHLQILSDPKLITHLMISLFQKFFVLVSRENSGDIQQD